MTKRTTRSGGRTGGLILLAAVLWAGSIPSATAGTSGQEEALPVLGLQECIDIALEGSVALAIAGAQREQAGQDVKAAWGSFLPNLSVGRTDVKDHRTDFDVTQYDIQTINLLTDQAGVVLPTSLQIPTDGREDEKTNTRYNDYNKRYHNATDGVIEAEVMANLASIQIYPITIRSEADLAAEIGRIATLSLQLGYRLEAEGRMLSRAEAYGQISHSASLLKAILVYLNQ